MKNYVTFIVLSSFFLAMPPKIATAGLGASVRNAAKNASLKKMTNTNQPTYKRLAIKSNDKVLYRCNPTKPCHFLPKDKVDSFDGGYNQVKIGQDTTFYRVSRDPNYTLYNVKRNAKAEEQFSYWKRDKSKGTQAIIDMAIPVSKNGNTAEYITAIRIPQGTIIYEGKVAKQGGLVGGGNQVVLKNIKKEWILQQY